MQVDGLRRERHQHALQLLGRQDRGRRLVAYASLHVHASLLQPLLPGLLAGDHELVPLLLDLLFLGLEQQQGAEETAHAVPGLGHPLLLLFTDSKLFVAGIERSTASATSGLEVRAQRQQPLQRLAAVIRREGVHARRVRHVVCLAQVERTLVHGVPDHDDMLLQPDGGQLGGVLPHIPVQELGGGLREQLVALPRHQVRHPRSRKGQVAW
mmetsp:Transcript_46800/g.150379  ORF Transcript_46800/g.150379 Transcript_46800/m.150379 type:complete len:211 (-) Transcript_46800:2347-2979(-)